MFVLIGSASFDLRVIIDTTSDKCTSVCFNSSTFSEEGFSMAPPITADNDELTQQLRRQWGSSDGFSTNHGHSSTPREEGLTGY